MIEVAAKEIVTFTKQHGLKVDHKPDKTVVTECDKYLDGILTSLAQEKGFDVVSEESESNLDIVKSGNYFITDAIDGSLRYITYVERSRERKSDKPSYVDTDLGPAYDHCLLLGIVENGRPRFGCCYNYVTGEKILLDSSSREHTIRSGNNQRFYSGRYVQYVEDRTKDEISKRISEDPSLDGIYDIGDIGSRAVVLQLNDHESAVTVHFAQQNGLWDILPACVAAEFTGATILDGYGEKIRFTDYLLIPGGGLTVHTGNKFSWVTQELRKGTHAF